MTSLAGSPDGLAPDFAAADLQGRPVRLSGYRGLRHVVLVFTNHLSCRYCRMLLAELRAAYPRFRALGGEVLVVGPDPHSLWKQLFDPHRLPLVAVPDPARRIARLFHQRARFLGLAWLPAAWIVDAAGRLRFGRNGASPRDIPLVEHLLAELRRIAERPGPGTVPDGSAQRAAGP